MKLHIWITQSNLTQGSYSFERFKFRGFFHDLFKFSIIIGLAVTFKNFQNFPCFRVFFDLKQFNRHKLWCPPKCMRLALFNYSSLYYCILHCPCLIICSNWSIKQNFNLPWLLMTENIIPWLFRPGKWNP